MIEAHCGAQANQSQEPTPGATIIATEWKNRIMKLKVVLEPSDEGGYTVYVPSLPGCISEGETTAEAMANIREAIDLYLEPVDDDFADKEGVEIHELVV
jgi:predicted RNase H-like HicB family nuclease